MHGVIANLITHTKFFVNQFRDFGLLTPEIWLLAISIGLAARYCNSINDKNCSLTIVLTAMDQKLQKS